MVSISNLIVSYTGDMLMLVLLLSMPPIVVAAFVGTFISLLQALTQIQEQTLGFAFKLIGVVVTIVFTAPWLGGELYNFAIEVFSKIGWVNQ